MQNETAYSKPVTLKNILKFAVPTIAMSVFMSFYTMVDGLFVSNLIGTNALSAINLVYPVIALVTAISTMLATGGSAAIMKKMGEGKTDEAKQDFTFLILVNVLVGLVMCGIGYLFMGKIFNAMSLSAEVSGYCKEYLSRYLLFTVPILLMNNFTLYMIAAGVFHYRHCGPVRVHEKKQSASFCEACLPLQSAWKGCHKWLFGNGYRVSQRHCYADVQLDNAQICRRKWRCRHYDYLLCAGLCWLSLRRIYLRCGPDD